jgi:uncharacterized lipoprotein YddW (UPF0748 family)
MLWIAIILLISLLTPGISRAEEQPIRQMRAFWVDSINPGFHTYAQVDELVDNVVRANANTIFVQVRRHGDAWYNNSIEPRAAHPDLAPADQYDPLGYMLQRAQAAGIKVHAWLVISVACRNNDRLRGHPDHVCTTHGSATPDPERWTTATFRGAQIGDLDFGHPAAIHHVEVVVQRLLENYPSLDGIHYDYIRYSDQGYGYNAVSLDRFRAAYGFPPSYRPTPGDPAWSQWRRDRITELVRRLYIRIKAINPRMQVSAATVTWGGVGSYTPEDWPNSAAYARVFQDWRAWLQEGILDFAVPMNYFAEGQEQTRNWYDGWLAWNRWNTGRRAIVVGTGAWLNNPQEGIAQIQRALTPDAEGRGMAGVTLFSYNQPISNSNPQWRREYMDLLRSSVFAQPALAPDWPWIVAPTTGHLQGMAAIDGQITPNAHITLLRDGAWERELTASADGWYGAVDLPPGVYSVVVRHPEDGRTTRINGLPVRAGVVTSGP